MKPIIRSPFDKTPTYLLCKGIQSLAKRVFWMGGNRQHPNGSIVRNYSFAEIIGKSGIYFYDTIRVGLFVQAPWNDYPAHAHDSEEWLVLIVRTLLHLVLEDGY